MSTPTIDFSKYESQAPSIDFSKYESKPAPSGPPDDWLKAHYANYGDTSIDQARERYNKRGMLDKIGDFMQDHNVVDNMTQHAINAIDAGKSGEYYKAANESVKSVAPIALAHLPGQLAVRPLATLAGVGTGMVGGAVTQGVAKAAGATPDQAELAGTVGGIGTGIAGGAATKALTPIARALKGVIPPEELVGLISPRASNWMRTLGKVQEVLNKSQDARDSGLADIVRPHQEKIAALEQQLNEALSKANALPPEGPTAKLTDVPDLRVQPGQQAPQNLLTKPAVGQAQPQPQGGAFKVVPPEGAIQEAGRLPDMEIYKEPIQPPAKLKPPTLLEQLRQWDQIRQIHSQLEDQIGKGQDELQQWMEDHNQQTPGGKSTAATAKAKFQAARAAAESKANAVPDDAPTVAYRVRDAGETGIQPKGHAQATTDLEQAQSYVEGRGSAQNAPQEVVKVDLSKLKPSEYTLKTGPGGKTWVQFKSAVPESFIEKVGDTPRVPTSDADMENLLMKSVQAAKAKKARAAAAGD